MSRNFRELLEKKWEEGKFVCIGLDTDLEKIPEVIRQEDTRTTMVAFNRAIVDALKKRVIALVDGHLVSDEEKGKYFL